MTTGRKKKNKKSITKKAGKKKPAFFSKKKKPKKKVSTKPRKKSAGLKPTKYKYGKDVFKIDLPRGVKNESVLNKYFDKINWKLKKFPDDQVKVTFFAKHGKELGGMTYIYDLPKSGNWVQNLDEIKNIFKEMARDIFKTKGKVKKFAGYLKEARIKDFINRIVIDFESSKI